MRQSETELKVLGLSKEYPGVEVCIAHPGVITNSTSLSRVIIGAAFGVVNVFTRAMPNIHLDELSAAVLDLTVSGFDKTIVSNNEMVSRGQSILKKQEASNH